MWFCINKNTHWEKNRCADTESLFKDRLLHAINGRLANTVQNASMCVLWTSAQGWRWRESTRTHTHTHTHTQGERERERETDRGREVDRERASRGETEDKNVTRQHKSCYATADLLTHISRKGAGELEQRVRRHTAHRQPEPGETHTASSPPTDGPPHTQDRKLVCLPFFSSALLFGRFPVRRRREEKEAAEGIKETRKQEPDSFVSGNLFFLLLQGTCARAAAFSALLCFLCVLNTMCCVLERVSVCGHEDMMLSGGVHMAALRAEPRPADLAPPPVTLRRSRPLCVGWQGNVRSCSSAALCFLLGTRGSGGTRAAGHPPHCVLNVKATYFPPCWCFPGKASGSRVVWSMQTHRGLF